MKLDRTLPAVWAIRGADVPALASVSSRAHTVVLDDVEYLCASIVVDVARSDAPYVPTERSDLYEGLGFLLGRTVEVLPRYDPTKGRRIHDPWTAGFKAWLHDELKNDLHDHWRSWFGRHGQKRLPTLSREEADGGRNHDDVYDGGGARARRLERAADEDPGDSGDAGLDGLRRRFLEGRDRALLREVADLGLAAPAGAGGRAPRADRGGGVRAAA